MSDPEAAIGTPIAAAQQPAAEPAAPIDDKPYVPPDAQERPLTDVIPGKYKAGAQAAVGGLKALNALNNILPKEEAKQ